MTPQRKIILASSKLQNTWLEFRKAMSQAAKQFTNNEVFPIGPMYAHDLPGASAEIDNAIKSVNTGDDISAQFTQGFNSTLHIELSWSQPS